MTTKNSGIDGNPEISMETVDGRELRVARWRMDGTARGGTGERLPLLFFNGIGANMEAVAPFAAMLEERPFIMFDMPGTGGSPDPLIPYNAILMARIADLLLERFGVDLADVMGISWGGAMAQHYALQHPRRVNRLVLAATTPGMFMIPGKLSALTKMADPKRYIDPDYMTKHFKTLYGGSDGGSEGHTGRITPPSKTGYFYQLLAMLGWTSAPFLPFMDKETLILMGSDDNIVVPANGRLLHSLIPNSTLKIIEGGGHLFMLSHLDESLAAIREHLDAPGSSRKAA
ncbi:MAG: alpha/beta hydrolase [Blastomonas sp.]